MTEPAQTQDYSYEIFEEAERQLKRVVEKILQGYKVPVTIGVPDAAWKKQYGYPMAAVMFGSADIVDWIEDGCPETTTEEGGKIIVENAEAEAQMVFAVHLAARIKTQLAKLTVILLAGISRTRFFGDDEEFHFTPPIRIRDELPGSEDERVFERIFSLGVSGTLTDITVTEKGEVEYVGEVSTEPEVLIEPEQEE